MSIVGYFNNLDLQEICFEAVISPPQTLPQGATNLTNLTGLSFIYTVIKISVTNNKNNSYDISDLLNPSPENYNCVVTPPISVPHQWFEKAIK